MTLTTTFMILLLSHFIGDYALQTNYIAIGKTHDAYILFAHVAIWTYVVSLTALLLKITITPSIIVAVLFLPHFIMDYLKAHDILFNKINSDKTKLTIDQTFHILQITILFGISQML